MGNTTNEQIMKKLDKLDRAMRPLPDRHWTQADIAARLQISENTVRSMLKLDGAPRPLAAATNEHGQMLKPRYSPERVLNWLEELDRLGQSSCRARAATSGS